MLLTGRQAMGEPKPGGRPVQPLWIPLLLVCTAVGLLGAPQLARAAEQRVALVIGNDSYRQIVALKNARTDARTIAKALEAVGFRVTLALDADEKAMKEALRSLKAQVGRGDEVVFYYSGHGVQLGANSYLLPVDIRGESPDQIRDEAIPLQRVLDDLEEQKARFSLAIIDACRDNPFKLAGRSIGGSGIGGATTVANGQMVIYSAGAGQQALDRLGNKDADPNGLFTRVFLKEMDKPGVPVDQVLRNVRKEVVRLARTVGHEQVPALYDQVVGEFFFRPGAGTPVANLDLRPAPPLPTVNLDDLKKEERTKWDAWQKSMQADFARAGAMAGGPKLESEAWARFLSAYASDNPFSGDDERMRTEAGERKARAEAALRLPGTAVSPEPPRSTSAKYAPGQSFRDCPECPQMTVLPARGTSDAAGSAQRSYILAVGTYEVTSEEWNACVKAGGCSGTKEIDDGRGRRPAANITLAETQDYLSWLRRRTKREYRLLDDGEWEFAARGGRSSAYPWGPSPAGDSNANCNGCGAPIQIEGKKTIEVGSFRPNSYGLYDVIGNVEEWVSGCPRADPLASGECTRAVVRGGSFRTQGRDAGIASRRTIDRDAASPAIGFRVAITLQ